METQHRSFRSAVSGMRENESNSPLKRRSADLRIWQLRQSAPVGQDWQHEQWYHMLLSWSYEKERSRVQPTPVWHARLSCLSSWRLGSPYTHSTPSPPQQHFSIYSLAFSCNYRYWTLSMDGIITLYRHWPITLTFRTHYKKELIAQFIRNPRCPIPCLAWSNTSPQHEPL